MFHYSEMLPAKQIQGRLWAPATPGLTGALEMTPDPPHSPLSRSGMSLVLQGGSAKGSVGGPESQGSQSRDG